MGFYRPAPPDLVEAADCGHVTRSAGHVIWDDDHATWKGCLGWGGWCEAALVWPVSGGRCTGGSWPRRRGEHLPHGTSEPGRGQRTKGQTHLHNNNNIF